MAVSAARLVLSLLTARQGRVLTAAELVEACRLLGATDNATRVALSRLQREGRIELEERGAYRLRADAERLANVARDWRKRHLSRVAFKGQYLALLTAGLGRADRTVLRKRERALELTGMRPWKHGLLLRPDNLKGKGAALVDRLKALGFPDPIDLVTVTLDSDQEDEVRALWDVTAYEREAERLTSEVHKLLCASERLSTEERAERSFWLGDEVIRFLVRDPLLPEGHCDQALARDLTLAMEQLDELGHAVWDEVIEQVRMRPLRKQA